MEQDRARAEFEAWISGKYPGIHWITDRDEKDQAAYRNQGVQSHWEAWRASREALVVELPQPFEGGDFTMYDGAEMLKAIHAAGISTK